MTRAIDGRLLLKVAAQVEDLQARVTELENSQRTNSAAIHRHSEALEVIGDVLSRVADIEDGEEGATLQ